MTNTTAKPSPDSPPPGMPPPNGRTVSLKWDSEFVHGLVPGTERVLSHQELSSMKSPLTVDHSGLRTGSWFYQIIDGVPATIMERAEGPHIAYAYYHRYELSSQALPLLDAHHITVSVATVAPNVGFPGGATQVRFLGYADPQSPAAPLSAEYLLITGILQEVTHDR